MLNRPLSALLAQICLAAYFQAIQWLPLGRWNYQPGFDPLLTQATRGNLEPSGVAFAGLFALPLLIYVVANVKRLLWLKWICLAGYAVWLWLQIQTWWLAYLFGASDRWARTYERVFSQSTRVLPSFGRHLAPDGVHLVLQVLLLVVVASLAAEVLRESSRQRGRAVRGGTG